MKTPQLSYIGMGLRNVYDLEHGNLCLDKLNNYLVDNVAPPLDEYQGEVCAYDVSCDTTFENVLSALRWQGALEGYIGNIFIVVLEIDSNLEILISDSDSGTSSFLRYYL